MLKKSVIILAGMLLLITSCFANTRMQQSAKQQPIPKVKEVTIMDFSQEKENVIYLAGGCFWGLEKLMQSIPGVIYSHSFLRKLLRMNLHSGSKREEFDIQPSGFFQQTRQGWFYRGRS